MRLLSFKAKSKSIMHTWLLIASLSASPQAANAAMCADLFNRPPEYISTLLNAGSRPSFRINEIRGVDQITLSAKALRDLRQIFEAAGLQFNQTSIHRIIESAAAQIKGNSQNGSLEKSERMATLGRQIMRTLNSELNTKPKKYLVNYLIAESVLRLESFRISDYQPDQQNSVFKNPDAVHITGFHALVRSYIDGTSTYANMGGSSSVLQWPSIRHLYANNSWIIGIKHHDMYHLHYAYGHPYYLAVNFHTSRSMNDRRYILASALWESVDTFRTDFEKAVADYFRGRRMSPEEGMLFLGSATNREITAIETYVAERTSDTDYVNQISFSEGWRPLLTRFGRNRTDYNESTFLSEVNNFVNQSLELMADPSQRRYINFHRDGPGQSTNRDQNTIRPQP